MFQNEIDISTTAKSEFNGVPFRVLREGSESSSDSSLQTNHGLSPRPQSSTQNIIPAGNQLENKVLVLI